MCICLCACAALSVANGVLLEFHEGLYYYALITGSGGIGFHGIAGYYSQKVESSCC